LCLVVHLVLVLVLLVIHVPFQALVLFKVVFIGVQGISLP